MSPVGPRYLLRERAVQNACCTTFVCVCRTTTFASRVPTCRTHVARYAVCEQRLLALDTVPHTSRMMMLLDMGSARTTPSVIPPRKTHHLLYFMLKLTSIVLPRSRPCPSTKREPTIASASYIARAP
ncbi:unnamed protein product, partial [Ectocarpus sp. 8 AP-2014]